MPFRLKKGETLKCQARKIVYNVSQFCSDEALQGVLKIPLVQSLKRTSLATGISKSTISKIKQQALMLEETGGFPTNRRPRRQASVKNIKIEEFHKCVIREIIQDFYIREKAAPTTRQLINILRDEISFQWERSSLQKVLRCLNFYFIKGLNNKRLLIEKPDVVFWRHRFIQEIKEHRKNGRAIVYISENWIDKNLMFKNWWPENTIFLSPNLPKSKLFILHAGSTLGFITGAQLIYKASNTDYISYENFAEWVTTKLIPNLPPHSVVCMDNAAYHMIVENPVPTKYATKEAMVDWLVSHGIFCDIHMRKPELFDLIESNRPKEVTYKIDQVFKQCGHDVIRLPPYHCDLNVIDYIWLNVKDIMSRNAPKDLDLDILQRLLCEAINSVTVQEWETAYLQVEKLEESYWKKDGLLEDVVDQMISPLCENYSDSDDSMQGDSDESESSESECESNTNNIQKSIKTEVMD